MIATVEENKVQGDTRVTSSTEALWLEEVNLRYIR